MSTKQVQSPGVSAGFLSGGSKCIVLCVLVLLLPFLIFSNVRGPRPPEEPQVQTFQDDSTADSQSSHATPAETGPWYSVEIFLEDGRQIRGRIPVEHEQFEVSHEVDGVEYKKRIHFKDVALFEIVAWKEIASSRAEGMHYIMPDMYRIRTDDGLEVMVNRRFQMFDEFILRNVNGDARFFTYFVDYWVGDAKSGYWENAKSESFPHVRHNPPGRVVRRIMFVPDSGN